MDSLVQDLQTPQDYMQSLKYLPQADLRGLLQSIYFSIELSRYFVNFIALFAVFSGILFEKFIVNSLFFNLSFNPLIFYPSAVPKRLTPTNVYSKVAFWFNDWLYDMTGKLNKLPGKKPIAIPDEVSLQQEEMTFTFIPWKRHKYKHIRALYTRVEKNAPTQIKQILLTCLSWNFFTSCFLLPIELYNNTLPFRVVIYLSIIIGLPIIWETRIKNYIDVTYFLREYRTNRVQQILSWFFYVIPFFVLFQSELIFYTSVYIMPYIKSEDPKLAAFLLKFWTKTSKIFIAAYRFVESYGSMYLFLLAIVALLDNWWDANVLPRYEKYKQGAEERAALLLDVYRVRHTDRLVAAYAFFVLALEVFGNGWNKVWYPRLYLLWEKLETIQVDILNTPNAFLVDGELIHRNGEIFANELLLRFITFFLNHINPFVVNQAGQAFHSLYSVWPTLVTISLAMLYRGMRYRGPDTYPNFGDPVPPYPYRTPFIVFNKVENYGRRTPIPSAVMDPDPNGKVKFIQLPMKCGWQKYFVRWNWVFAFSMSFFDNVLLRGVLYRLVGRSAWYPIQVSYDDYFALKRFFIDFEAWIWFYGLIFCFIGRCIYFPLTNRTCRYHVGRFAPVPARLRLRNFDNPIIFYPYDKIEIKKALWSEYPSRQPIPRLRKLQIFINVMLSKFGFTFYLFLFMVSYFIYLNYFSIDNMI